jgi:5'-nucleotidase
VAGRQGLKNARPIITEKIDPRGKAYYWIGEEVFPEDTVEGTDYYAVKQGMVSVTPMRSDMTDHRSLVELQDWNSHSPIENVPAEDQTVGRA